MRGPLSWELPLPLRGSPWGCGHAAVLPGRGTGFETRQVVLSALFRNPLALETPADGMIGRYELVRPLGIGGMAEVFEARATGPGGFTRTVVIKRILPAFSRQAEFRRMFIDEAKILGMIHHPNVVQVYDFGEDDDGTLFLALELVDGPPISHVLRRLRAHGRKMSPGIAAYIAREVCRALDYVHTLVSADGEALGIIHRDVSPSNIMLTSGGAVKLLDFGVAKCATARQRTKAGTVKGKPAYLAPEQVQGHPIDGRVDLFALGIVLHEMLTLEHLFAGDSELATLRKILELAVPVPSQSRADVPADLDHIVLRALERDPARRYATAADMARDLDEFVLGCGIEAREVAAFIADLGGELRALGPAPLTTGADGSGAASSRRLSVGRELGGGIGDAPTWPEGKTIPDEVAVVTVDDLHGCARSAKARGSRRSRSRARTDLLGRRSPSGVGGAFRRMLLAAGLTLAAGASAAAYLWIP